MIGKDTRTCRQEAKRGQCLPGFDCFERNHPSLDAHMGVWDSQSAPAGEEGIRT